MRTFSARSRGAVIAAVLVAFVLLAAVAIAGSLPFGSVQRVNVAYDGGLANGEGLLGLACSADGRYVAFASSASNILEGDTNGRCDIFWRDMVSEETTLVNVTMSGGFGSQGALNYVEMTPDGRYVLFYSNDSDVVPGDTNGYPDVFVRDMVSKESTCVSTAADGTFEDYYPSGDGSLSDDGRYAVYSSMASNLFPGDTNGKQDCILKDLQSGDTTNVSYTYDGGLGNNHSFYPVISGDGTKVAFISYATGMVPGDVSALGNLFLRDLVTGEIERVDATTAGGESVKEVDLIYCDVDYTGQHVVFGSRQNDIVSVPVGVASQVYLRDTVADETTVVARTIDGEVADNQNNNPRISSDGRWVSFLGQATNLVAGDTNNMGDLFLRDMQSDSMERLNLSVDGEQLDRFVYDQALGANATAIAFNTSATNILDTYTSPALGHIYVRVFRTNATTTTVALTSSSKTLSAYGQSYQLRGTLRSGGIGLGGRQVRIQTYASGAWSDAPSIHATTFADGTFSVNVTPRDKTYYRAYYAGDGLDYLASPVSGYVRVIPRPWVGTPKAPATMKRTRYYTVYGYMKPRHTVGSYPVRIAKYRRSSSGKWVYYGYVKAKAYSYSATYTKYSAKIRLSKAGRWRLRAYAPADSNHASMWSSGYDYVTVK
ncbi:MAG: hypothetical protein CVT67_03995 [Actinobacteria bacterium HGW-Actinobacteria-7]|nr:MAG: hypothetical protein CVT67_03995 [Actinobacteria bacterium HGW-Actinobacteria-7]